MQEPGQRGRGIGYEENTEFPHTKKKIIPFLFSHRELPHPAAVHGRLPRCLPPPGQAEERVQGRSQQEPEVKNNLKKKSGTIFLLLL